MEGFIEKNTFWEMFLREKNLDVKGWKVEKYCCFGVIKIDAEPEWFKRVIKCKYIEWYWVYWTIICTDIYVFHSKSLFIYSIVYFAVI